MSRQIDHLGFALCEALGLPPDKVQGITLAFDAGFPPKVTVRLTPDTITPDMFYVLKEYTLEER